MGINNRQRRAAKARRRARDRADRARRHQSHSDPTESIPYAHRDRIHALLRTIADSARHDEILDVAPIIRTLASSDPRMVDQECEGLLLSLVTMLWDNGWQPAEVVRLARRADARTGRLAALVVAADHSVRDSRTLHSRWAAQLEALDLPSVEGATGWLAVFRTREWLHRIELVETVVALVQALCGVGPLPTIIPPPGAAGRSGFPEADVTVDDPVLVKVRALLAQAESTTFEAEAEAFTAKAQELMARHAIDAAVVWARSERDERPATIRLPIDDPYAGIKSMLLQYVASHSRCKAVYHPAYRMSSVIGFASDLAAAEILFTSLLVQAQAALRVEAAKAGPGGRTRSSSFRSSFLMSFTTRINERLAEINAAVETAAAAEHDTSLLPVLAARDGAVDEAVDELFGRLVSSIVRGGSDAAGWVRGRIAADLAQLNYDLEAAEQASLVGEL